MIQLSTLSKYMYISHLFPWPGLNFLRIWWLKWVPIFTQVIVSSVLVSLNQTRRTGEDSH